MASTSMDGGHWWLVSNITLLLNYKWRLTSKMFNINYLKDALKSIRFKIINDFGTGILLNSIPRNDRSKIDLKEAGKLIRIEVQLNRMQECKAGGTIFHCLLKK